MSSGSTWECVWLTVEPMNGCSVWQRRSLKSALWGGLGEKKKWLKVENIPREAAFQHTVGPAPSGTTPRSDWPSNYPVALWLDGSNPLLMPVCPSLQHFQQGRGEILHRSGLNDSTVRPFRGRRRPALWGRVDMLYQTNKQSWGELLPRVVTQKKKITPELWSSAKI